MACRRRGEQCSWGRGLLRAGFGLPCCAIIAARRSAVVGRTDIHEVCRVCEASRKANGRGNAKWSHANRGLHLKADGLYTPFAWTLGLGGCGLVQASHQTRLAAGGVVA